MEKPFRLPNEAHRVAVIGRTGSGKSMFGFWLLTVAPLDRLPYVAIDYKGEELFEGLDRIKELGTKEKLPKEPGLYIVRPNINDDAGMESWLERVHAHEYIGLFADEAYMLPQDGRSPAFRAILTQGRSKRIPVISLTQRPVAVSRFVFSEANFYALFHLNDQRDYQTVRGYMPGHVGREELPEFHCHWYDVGANQSHIIRPVPDAETLRDRLHERLKPRRRKV